MRHVLGRCPRQRIHIVVDETRSARQKNDRRIISGPFGDKGTSHAAASAADLSKEVSDADRGTDAG